MNTIQEKENVREWLSVFSSAAKTGNYSSFYKRAYNLLSVPSRKRKAVTLYKLDRYTKDGDNVIVPAKLLSTGKLSHKLNITVLECSSKAEAAIKASGSRIIDVKDMVKNGKVHLII